MNLTDALQEAKTRLHQHTKDCYTDDRAYEEGWEGAYLICTLPQTEPWLGTLVSFVQGLQVATECQCMPNAQHYSVYQMSKGSCPVHGSRAPTVTPSYIVGPVRAAQRFEGANLFDPRTDRVVFVPAAELRRVAAELLKLREENRG